MSPLRGLLGNATTCRSTTREWAPSYTILATVACATVACDICTKLSAQRYFAGHPGALEVWKHYVIFVFIVNRGAAWGLLPNITPNLFQPFFFVSTVVAAAVIVLGYRRLKGPSVPSRWGFALLLGGVLGNEVDRLWHGYVADFIKLYVPPDSIHARSTCNLADLAIRIGFGLIGVDFLISKRAGTRTPANTRVTGRGGSRI
jgi:signal peptidase II